MANSKRKQILNYLRDTVFARITTGSGYNFTLGTRARGLREVDALPDSAFPCLYISASAEDRQNITSNQFKSELKVAIVGYVKCSNGVDGTQEELDNLIEDLTEAIETDRKLGGLSKWLEIESITTDDGDQEPYAAFVASVKVVYVTEGTSA